MTHHDDAGSDFAFSVELRDAPPQLRTELHGSDVSKADRRSPVALDDDLLEIALLLHVPVRAHHVLGAAPFDKSPSDLVVRVLHRLRELDERDAVGGEFVRIDRDLVLPHEPADARHFGDAGDRLQLVADVPVFEGAQIGERTLAGGIDEGVLVYPPDARCVGTKLGLHAFRKGALYFRQVLEDAAPCPVEIGAILEDDIDVRVTEVGEAANGFDLRRAEE